ncbi:MAG: substrate-binding domain-containing protein [Gemmatimonadales bacterium]
MAEVAAQPRWRGSGRSLPLFAILPLLPLAPACARPESRSVGSATITLATTTSVRDSRLLDALLPPFERATGYDVKVLAVGSGQALELGRRGEADLLLVHDPEGERAFVEGGYGKARVPLMHNEFVIVGPSADPARVRGLSVIRAFLQIADSGALFISRADRSGTHTREQALWALAGRAPRGAWYRESGQGMSATLQIADQLGAYTLTDVGTLFSHRYPLQLEILVEGDSLLHNPYHLMVPDSGHFPWLEHAGARVLLEYLVGDGAREVIAAFGRDETGRTLFVPAPARP